jgi:hypothetical protein
VARSTSVQWLGLFSLFSAMFSHTRAAQALISSCEDVAQHMAYTQNRSCHSNDGRLDISFSLAQRSLQKTPQQQRKPDQSTQAMHRHRAPGCQTNKKLKQKRKGW